MWAWWGIHSLVSATLRCQDTVGIMPCRLSMLDETVETRHPWLDFSLPRRPCLGISVLYSIILQTLNSCAIRPPYSTAYLHPGILSAFMWEAQNLQRFPLTSSPCEASPTYSSPFVIWPPGCVRAHLPPASVSYPAYSEA